MPRSGEPDPVTAGGSGDLTIPEGRRKCPNGHPVGRGREGRPGRTSGFCPKCGLAFSFVAPLENGVVVNNQYEIVRCLALGGLGWVYLAKDRMVSDRLVVLKGMIDSTDQAKVQLSIAERQFLAGVNHTNVVRIHNFVYHEAGGGDRSGYIVMEYVQGQSLKDVMAPYWARARKHEAVLPLEQALGFVVDILPAFGYLHEQGLLYCDFKPDNVIAADRVILVDLGAVRQIDDTDTDFYGTTGYQAPEVADGHPPTVDADLYTIGRALAVMAMKFDFHGEYAASLPGPEQVPLLRENESFRRLLARAAAPRPARRFAAAAEMYDQVLGVLRETLAAAGNPQYGPSRLFTGEQRDRADGDSDGPDPADLPAPRIDPDDPATAYLETITVDDPDAVLALLEQAPEQTVEVAYAALLAELRAVAGDPERLPAARQRLARAADRYGAGWRHEWYSGLVELAAGDPARAGEAFDRLYDLLPGEPAVKLALAVSLELAGVHAGAARLYDIVCRTDPSYTMACTGLGRCRVALGDYRGAAEAYRRVPVTSAAYRSAQVEAVLALVRHDGPAPVTAADAADLTAASALIRQLGGPPAERARLRAILLEAVLRRVAAGSALPTDLGIDPPSEHGVRTELERCYRDMARYVSGLEKVRLVDRANAVRPHTLV
jgi:serine/threonine-protein kinase PknG